MAFPSAAEITKLVAPVAQRHNVDIEGVKIASAGKKSRVTIAIGADTPVDLDLLEELSREISQRCDAAEEAGTVNFGPGYQLEVTTIGVAHPLTEPRHWRRNRGRLVEIDGELARVGALDAAEEHVVLFPVSAQRGAGKNAKKRKQDAGGDGSGEPVRILDLRDCPLAVVQVEFSNPAPREQEMVALSFDQAAALRKES